jgi:hypothetical protein
MKLFKKMRDGGPESPVVGYFLVEIKSLFSIVLLHFGGTREAYHSHAFNAVTLWLKGRVFEQVKNESGTEWHKWGAGNIKYTPRSLMHKVVPITDAWAISFRGPWARTWQEYRECETSTAPRGEYVTLAHGRKVVAVEAANA